MMSYRRKFVSSSHPNSFLRESGKLYVLYMVGGVAAVPAGALYALLASKGFGQWWTALAAIVLGFWMAKEARDYVELKFFTRGFTASGASITWALTPAAATAVAALMLSLPPAARVVRTPTNPLLPTGADTVATISVEEAGFCTEQRVLTIEPQA
jgi:hypothetical protein